MSGPSSYCVCGHVRYEHHAQIAKNDTRRCAMMACTCQDFNAAPVRGRARVKTVKTLDQTDPRLFEVQLAVAQ